MEGLTLKSRAIAFAFCTGAIAFILALFAGAQADVQSGDFTRAIVLALVCGVMSWASAERSIASYAEAVDDSIDRLSRAAEGDLLSPTPDSVGLVLPELADSLDRLLAQVRANLASVQTLAMFDAVTKLPNRTHFRRDAAQLLEELPEDGLAGLFFIDLDKFKSVNDTFGHAQGDQLLIKVADRLRALKAPGGGAFARQPLIGRLAGDEFTMLVPMLQSRDEAERVGDALLDALSEPYELLGRPVDVGASIGVALRPDQGRSLHDLMRAADIAMYEAKASGRGRCQLFTPSLAARLADNLRLEHELRTAIEDRQFVFLYQPQLSCGTDAPVAAEAMLRWQHPIHGLLSPRTFFAQAEETGLIQEIGLWAVDELAATLSRWERRGVITRLSVDISSRQIARPDFFAQVRQVLDRHRTSADLLELEIGETIAMDCEEAALAGIARLREQGATIALDHFGTGMSNLSRLKDLPIDRVKMHPSLIADLISSEKARMFVQSVIGLIHGLGFSVTATGVATRAQRTILEVAGCDQIQGQGVATAMPEKELHEWLEAHQVLKRRA